MYGISSATVDRCIPFTELVGFTSDGEWNSLRTKGNSRPLSVFQIRADVRSKYSHMSMKRMVEMITPICTWMLYCTDMPVNFLLSGLSLLLDMLFILGENGAITALLPNHAVSPELLGDLKKWNSEGASLDDAIELLRL